MAKKRTYTSEGGGEGVVRKDGVECLACLLQAEQGWRGSICPGSGRAWGVLI